MAGGSVALLSLGFLRLALGGAVTYDVAVRTEGRARERSAFGRALAETEVDPRLGLTWADARSELGVAYYPRLFAQEQGDSVTVLHRAAARANRQLDATWRGSLAAEGSYGTNESLAFTAGAAGQSSGQQPVQPVLGVTALRYVSGEGSLALESAQLGRWRQRWQGTAFVDGGADDAARVLLPLQRGGRLAADFGYTASAVDVLDVALRSTVSTFGDGAVDGYAAASVIWRRDVSREVRLRLGAGPAVGARRQGDATSWTPLASAEAGLTMQRGPDVTLDLGVRVTPMVDRITAAVYDRADATASMTWQPVPRWTLACSATAGVVAGGPQERDGILSGDARLSWSPKQWLELGAGVAGAGTLPHAGPDLFEGVVFLAVTVSHRGRL